MEKKTKRKPLSSPEQWLKLGVQGAQPPLRFEPPPAADSEKVVLYA